MRPGDLTVGMRTEAGGWRPSIMRAPVEEVTGFDWSPQRSIFIHPVAVAYWPITVPQCGQNFEVGDTCARQFGQDLG